MSGTITIDLLGKVGPFISGTGILFGFFLAVYNVIVVRRQDKIDRISDSYLELYKEFWEDDDIAPVRRAIINTREYSPYERVLRLRNFTQFNELNQSDNDFIEVVDRFCSMLVRLKSMEEHYMPSRQRALWNKTLNGELWLQRINNRHEFRVYIEKCWPELTTPATPWYRRF